MLAEIKKKLAEVEKHLDDDYPTGAMGKTSHKEQIIVDGIMQDINEVLGECSESEHQYQYLLASVLEKVVEKVVLQTRSNEFRTYFLAKEV